MRLSIESGRNRRRRRAIESLLAASFLALAAQAFALEFRSVNDAGAVLYDSPSTSGKKLYVVSRGYPLEVLVTLEHWVKVRDASGTVSWIERKSLGDKRLLLVIAEAANIRETPAMNAPLAFRASRDVVLEFVEAGPPGWVKVKHRDGAMGFVQSSEVWGL